MFRSGIHDDALVWVIGPEGRLAIAKPIGERDGKILLEGGGNIERKSIDSRGRLSASPAPFLLALTQLPENLELAARQFIGRSVPAWFEAEMREALAAKVRDGLIVLAGKRLPLDADSGWHRFDPLALPAWNFRLDDTASPILGGGPTYALVTAFSPDQWNRAQAAKGGAPKPPLSVAVEWLRDAYSGPIKPKSKVAIADCVRETGVTVREAKAALAQVDERRTRGRPRGGRS